MQTKRHSIIEQLLNVGSGFVLSSLVWQFVILKYWDIHTSFSENLEITSVFTIVSIARGYIWRRLFNKITVKHHERTCSHPRIT
jgi:hypothetical protein